MQIWELFIIAVGLSMDAFAVAVCKGLSVRKVSPGHALTAGLYFGGFQALMPLLGYFLGTQFESLIQSVDHWIAFALLGLIGANMIRESRSESEEFNDSFGPKAMLPLAVGVTFAFLQVQIAPAVAFIGVITFALSCLGVKLGNVFGAKYKSRAELFGGVVLILMGAKILLEHLLQG